MSYYCKGEDCKRKEACLRYFDWFIYPNKEVEQGFATGVWFVNEVECIANDYGEGVF